jgi:hypothetical protein
MACPGLSPLPLKYPGSGLMDSEHHTLLIKTRALIETTRYEILQLREEIQSAWNTIDRSQRLLSRTEPSTPRIASVRREARARQ